MQQREVADDDTRHPRATRRLAREGDAEPRRDRAVDAGEPAVRVHGNLFAREHLVGHAHEPRRREQQPIVRPRRPPHRVDERRPVDRSPQHVEFGGDRPETFFRHGGCQGVGIGGGGGEVDGSRARRAHPGAEPFPVLVADRGDHRVDRCRRIVEVDRLPRPAHGVDLDVGAREQGRHLTAERRMPEHDRPFDAAAQFGVGEQRPVAVHEIPSEARARDDLGDERPPARVRQRFGGGPGIRSRDDDRAGTALEHVRIEVGIARQVGLADATAALVERTRQPLLDHGRGGSVVGTGVCGDERRRRDAEPVRQRTGKRLAVRQVQMHGSRLPRARTERRCERLVGDGAEHVGLLARTVVVGLARHRQVGLETHARREHAGLAGGLVGADAAQLGRAVGGQQQHRHARVVGFERRGQQVRHRRARRAENDGRHPALAPDAERREPCDPLVDAHVHGCQAARLELGSDQGESLRARAGAHDDVADAPFDEPAEQGGGGVGRGRRLACRGHVSRAHRATGPRRRRRRRARRECRAGRGRRLRRRGRRARPRDGGCARLDR